MESSSAPRFRFRDHSLPESRNSIHSSEPSSDDVVSVLSLSNSNNSIDQPDDNAKLDIESITGRVLSYIIHFSFINNIIITVTCFIIYVLA